MIGAHIDDLDTPVLTVELDQLAANIARFQRYLDSHGIANRPHIKTHKIPIIAAMQIAAGAVGITCQKLSEAEVMADAGIGDIFIPYNIVGAPKLERLMRLAQRVRLSVTADHSAVVAGLAQAARAAQLTLSVLVECDTGMSRCGVQSPHAAAELSTTIARAPSLHFGGLMTYPSSARAEAFVAEARALLAARGIAVERVSGGGTSCMWQAHTFPAISEHRAGEYVYGDRHAIAAGAMRPEECSFAVVATVISRPTVARGILDAGSKTLSSDVFETPGHGLILEYPEAQLYALSEEHGHVDFSACERPPAIGERVRIIPNHCCVVSNLFDSVAATRDGRVVALWLVAARGRVQ